MIFSALTFLLSLFPFVTSAAESDHLFCGKHFLASYQDCDLDALGDVEGVVRALDDAVRASGATILDSCSYVFKPNGLTRVYLLSESHASIHTYPEHGSCFVDLFTCGDNCSSDRFDQILRAYLQPGTVNSRLLLRHTETEELVR